MPRIIVGVDGGGTRTRAVVIEASPAAQDHSDGTGQPNVRVLGRGEAASCNHYSAGWEAAGANLLRASRQALESAGLDSQRSLVDPELSWGLGLAGVASHQEATQWRQYLRPSLAATSRITVGDDALAAQSGAFAGGPGAIIIAGTGANAYSRNALGQTARIDALGPLLGDRGSGYWIGEAALRAIARFHDGLLAAPDSSFGADMARSDQADAQKPGAQLHREVLEFFQVSSVEALIPLVYGPLWTKNQAAALAPIVAHAAHSGDPAALAVLHAAGTELALTARAVLLKTRVAAIAPLGGVLENIAPTRQAFEDALRAHLPRVQITAPRFDAAVGAALLALEPSPHQLET